MAGRKCELWKPVAVGLALLIVVAACSDGSHPAPRPSGRQPPPAQTLRVRLTQAPRSLDPAMSADPFETAVTRQLVEPLLKPAADLMEVRPAAAAAYEVSADGLSYTFHLRPDGRWSDGQPVRASDFVYAWRRLVDPRTLAPLADLFAGAVRGGDEVASLDPKNDAARIGPALDRLGVRAPDDLTFEVTLDHPQGYFKWIATLPQGAPARADVIAKHGPDWAGSPDTLICNGPFKAVEIKLGDQITLVPNPSYWGGGPGLAELRFEVVATDQEAVARYARGALDVVGLPVLSPPAGAAVLKQAELTSFWLDFNTARAPFDNSGVRRAFAAAIDRPALIAQALAGKGEPLGAPVPAGMHGHLLAAQGVQAFDPAAARAQLAASGASPADLGSIHFLALDRGLDRAVAVTVQAQIEQNLGLHVTIDIVPVGPAALRRLQRGDFQLTGPAGWTADYPDPQGFMDLFRTTDGHDLARWRNPGYDLLVRQADAELDPIRRDQLYSQAQQLLVAEAPAAFLEQRDTETLVRPAVKGIMPTALDEWPGSLFASSIRIG